MKKILIIDDIEFTRKTISLMLSRKGFEVYEAIDGREGIEVFKEKKPELVLTDILMPEMEGFETIRALKTLSPKLPIIAITGSHDSSLLIVAKRLGAIHALPKPFKQEDLLNTIEECLAG